MSRNEIRSSLLVGGSIYLALLAVELTTAYMRDSFLGRLSVGGLYPGLYVAYFFFGAPKGDTGMGVMWLVFAVGTTMDVALYSAAALVIRRCVVGWTRQPDQPSTGEKTEPHGMSSFGERVRFALLLGGAIYVSLVALGLVTRWHWLGLCLSGGYWMYRLVFGDPAHGAGLWLVTATIINWLIYSTVLFIVEVAVTARRRRAALH